MKKKPLFLNPVLLGVYLVLTWAGVFAVRMLGPGNLLDDDQQRPAAYVLDALVNGNWIVQTDDTGDITSKPPFYTWVVAITAKVTGDFNEFSLYLPGALAVLGMALLVFVLGRRCFGWEAAFVGAVGVLLSSVGFKQVHLARTDALFSLAVAAAAVLAVAAARKRTTWVWFWVAAAVATLTKGPLGGLLALGALLGLIGYRGTRPGEEASRDGDGEDSGRGGKFSGLGGLYGQFFLGMGIFLALAGGWFLLAYIQAGQPLVDKMIGKELIGHAVESGSGQKPLEGWYKPILYFLSRFLPWSVLALIGIGRTFLRPAKDRAARLGERVLTAYFLFGLAVFSVAPHQRWDHLVPLIPAAALLAGREVVVLVPRRMLWRGFLYYPAIAAVVLAVTFAGIYMTPNDKEHRTALSKKAAGAIYEAGGSHFPVMYMDDTMGVQFFLGSMRLRVPPALARRALASDRAAYVLVQNKEDYRGMTDGLEDRVYTVMAWQEPGREYPFLQLLGNRETLEYHDRMVVVVDGLEVKMNNVEVRWLASEEMIFLSSAEDRGSVSIHNMSPEKRTVKVEIQGVRGSVKKKLRLDSGEEGEVK